MCLWDGKRKSIQLLFNISLNYGHLCKHEMKANKVEKWQSVTERRPNGWRGFFGLTCEFKNVRLFPGQFLSGHVCNRSKDDHRSEEPSWAGKQRVHCECFIHVWCLFASRAPRRCTGGKICTLVSSFRSTGSHLPSAQPFHRQGTWSGPAAQTDPPCSSAGSSWSSAALWTSRSRLCLRRGSWGGCTAHWTAARLCTGDSSSEG